MNKPNKGGKMADKKEIKKEIKKEDVKVDKVNDDVMGEEDRKDLERK